MATQYEITNTKSGANLGIYSGETPDAAIAAMLADAGDTSGEVDSGLVARPVRSYEIQERNEHTGNAWATAVVGDENRFGSEADAHRAIESLRALGWTSEYRVREIKG